MPHKNSILSPSQRLLLRLVVAGGSLLVADALFLLLFRVAQSTERFRLPPDTLPVFYQIMVLFLHTGLGLLLAPLALGFALWHLKRALARKHPSAVWTGLGLILLMLGLVISGVFIMYEANSRDNRYVYWAHIGLGVALPAIYVLHRAVSAAPPLWSAVRRTFVAIAGAALLFLGVHVVTVTDPDAGPLSGQVATVMPHVRPLQELKSPGDPFVPFAAFGDVSRESRFFPSAATTATGNLMESRVVTRDELPPPEALAAEVARHGFVKDHLIGAETCVRCHADIVEQWSHSAHRFSSMNNPFYRKPFLDMRERPDIGNIPSQWCSGCHEPALMQAGQVSTDFNPDGANAQAGLTCLACHAIDAIHNNTGNGNYNIPDHEDSPYLWDDSKEGITRALSDILIKAKPTVHKERMLKPFFRTSEFCATCHKVSLDVPVNKYRWFRGQNEYDNWHDSGVSRNAARTFYLPDKAKNCQECHMPPEDVVLGDVAAKEGKVRSHRFLAVNTALPTLRDDQDHIARTEAFLQDKKMRVDLFVLRRLDASGEEKEWIPALSATQPVLQPGELVEVQVVVRNLGVGHTFPGGTNDSNEGWVEFRVDDAGGKNLFHSGHLDKNLRLEPSAERYTVLMLDHQGGVAGRRNPHDFHIPMYTKVIGPGTADVVRYQFRVPQSAEGGELSLRADLNWRKFKQEYSEYVFEGKQLPVFPVTRIAGDQVKLKVAGAGESVPLLELPPLPKDLWMKFNDLGIALLLDNDTRGAQRAFEVVVAVDPDRVDGYRNLARVHLQDGNFEACYRRIGEAENRMPGSAQTAWVWGNLALEDGNYVEAVKAYQRTLQDFPSDRDTLARLGRALYLLEDFAGALEVFLQVLRIDPESANAHYHRMLCYRGLGDAEKANAAEAAYLKYKEDDDAQALTQQYRLKDPHAQFLSQPIHVHQLVQSTPNPPTAEKPHEGTR